MNQFVMSMVDGIEFSVKINKMKLHAVIKQAIVIGKQIALHWAIVKKNVQIKIKIQGVSILE